jgi:hypothetical protein
MKSIIKKVVYWVKIGTAFGIPGVVIGGILVGFSVGSTVPYIRAQEVQVPVYVDTMPEKIEALKDEVVNDLAKCESGGKKEEDGIVILDSNNKGSYGVMQWQKTSYQHYYKIMTGSEISGKDAIIDALDAEKAKKLAKYVIFETKSGVAKDWVVCDGKHKLQERVNIIKKLIN